MDPALIGASLAVVPVLTALSAVAGFARARKRRRIREHLRKVDLPGSRKDLALIIAMGGDPLKHRIEPVKGQWRGLRLVDDDGRPFRSMTEKQLRSAAMRMKWRQAERTVQLQIEGP